MTKTLNLQEYNTTYQLKLPVEISTIIEISDPVYTFCEVMDCIDLRKYLVTEENKEEYSFDNVVVMGSSKDIKTIAHGLFDAIRRLDEMEVDIILCEAVKEDEIGMAIMNRLLKAAGGNRIYL